MTDDYKSRSQKKRESTAMQRLGEELAELSPATLDTFGLPPDLAEALAVWRTLKTHEAKRRHMQYIGKLMRELDEPELLMEHMDRLHGNKQRENRQFKHIEEMRAALLQPDEPSRAQAFQDALARLAHVEAPRLRHLVEAALAEREKKRPPRAFRELFRYLKPEESKKATDE